MKKRVLTLAAICALGSSLMTFAQDEQTPMEKLESRIEALESDMAKEKKLKVTGYIQTQMELAQPDAKTKLGGSLGKWDNEDLYGRVGIRRGRIKFDYTNGIAKGVFQLDITEKGVGFKDAYLQITEPTKKWIGVKAGMFDRPFANDIMYSSSRRETPERALVTQALFDGERDLGMALILAAPKGTMFEGLNFEGGFFSGNGINRDDDGAYDFIGRLKYERAYNKVSFGVGASLYAGNVYNATYGTDDFTNYKVVDGAWEKSAGRKFNQRTYGGIDAQFTGETRMGLTNIRAEYVWGVQPSQSSDFMSPIKGADSGSGAYATKANYSYLRNFAGANVYFVQDLFRSPVSLVLRYSYLDQNTKMDRHQAASKADIANQAAGVGALWNINSALRLITFFDFNINEKAEKVKGYEQDRKDNILTVRLQYKF